MQIKNLETFEKLLRELSGLDFELSDSHKSELSSAIAALDGFPTKDKSTIRKHFYGRINEKLNLNQQTISEILRIAAVHGRVFNFHEKKEIAKVVNQSDRPAFVQLLETYLEEESIRKTLAKSFTPITTQQTMASIASEATNPTKLRKALARRVASDVAQSLAGSLLWAIFEPQDLYKHFNPTLSPSDLSSEYLEMLRQQKPALFKRSRSLVVRGYEFPKRDTKYEDERARLESWISSEYVQLDNYGHLAIVLILNTNTSNQIWRLSADLTLFAERLNLTSVDKGFFRPHEIETQTRNHCPDIDSENAHFELVNEGFTYRDLFVLHNKEFQPVRLVLLFQKNVRDETPIPCPSCRTLNVRGNSYPSFGVKSWECMNPLCPEKSIYDRGKRFSFKGLLYQSAIEDPQSQIPIESIRRWRRDVLEFVDDQEIITMLIRHYSMADDQVTIINYSNSSTSLSRSICTEDDNQDFETISNAKFRSGPYFARYMPTKHNLNAKKLRSINLDGEKPWHTELGDAQEVLKAMPSEIFDRIVTSPPYFNARDYSQWPNLYCYLYDMANIHFEAFRTLKKDGLYFFNIFDYFDNERIVTFSDMGKKRIALSAHFVDLFERLGMSAVGCLVWDKGDVEGKRSFNAGNQSPFYQAPLNCWEHVLVFQKSATPSAKFNFVHKIRPVIKMVRGRNTYGHTAPFPIELPKVCIEGLKANSLVLDPFSGSGTTARAAISAGLRCMLIELDPVYAELGDQLTASFIKSLDA